MPSVTDWISAVSSIVSAAGVLAAGWWFFETNQRKQRVQFDLDCRFFRWPGDDGSVLAEVWFIFENKGFVEHRLYDIRVSAHVDVPVDSAVRADASPWPWFAVTKRESIVPAATGFYFVRPGVHQVIRHVIRLPGASRLVRVTASFDYHTGDQYPHTARRVFAVTQEPTAQADSLPRHDESLSLTEPRSVPSASTAPAARLRS